MVHYTRIVERDYSKPERPFVSFHTRFPQIVEVMNEDNCLWVSLDSGRRYNQRASYTVFECPSDALEYRPSSRTVLLSDGVKCVNGYELDRILLGYFDFQIGNVTPGGSCEPSMYMREHEEEYAVDYYPDVDSVVDFLCDDCAIDAWESNGIDGVFAMINYDGDMPVVFSQFIDSTKLTHAITEAMEDVVRNAEDKPV